MCSATRNNETFFKQSNRYKLLIFRNHNDDETYNYNNNDIQSSFKMRAADSYDAAGPVDDDMGKRCTEIYR